MRPDAEMRVDGADILQNGSIIGETSAGPRSDLFYLAGNLAAGGAIVLRFQCPFHSAGEQAGNLVNLSGAFGADIDLGASLAGNGVDAGAALDDPEVVGRARAAAARKAMLSKERDCARESVHRIGDPIVAPAVAARPGNSDIEPPAGQRLRGDVVGIGAVQDQERPDTAAGG